MLATQVDMLEATVSGDSWPGPPQWRENTEQAGLREADVHLVGELGAQDSEGRPPGRLCQALALTPGTGFFLSLPLEHNKGLFQVQCTPGSEDRAVGGKLHWVQPSLPGHRVQGQG